MCMDKCQVTGRHRVQAYICAGWPDVSQIMSSAKSYRNIYRSYPFIF